MATRHQCYVVSKVVPGYAAKKQLYARCLIIDDDDDDDDGDDDDDNNDDDDGHDNYNEENPVELLYRLKVEARAYDLKEADVEPCRDKDALIDSVRLNGKDSDNTKCTPAGIFNSISFGGGKGSLSSTKDIPSSRKRE